MIPVLLTADSVSERFRQLLTELLASFGFRLLGAAAILLIGLRLVSWVMKLVGRSRLLHRSDPSVGKFLLSALRIVLYAVVIMSAAVEIGVPAASLITVLSSGALAIGLAMQGSLSNLAGSLMILVFKPFRVGDYIETASGEGTVDEINLFYTVLITVEQKVITIPNGAMTNAAITNYSRLEKMRVSLKCSVAYTSDPARVKEVLLRCAAENPLTLPDPEPWCVLSEHGDSALVFTLRATCRGADYWTLRFQLLEAVKLAFDREGISIPFPQMDVHIKDTPAAP